MEIVYRRPPDRVRLHRQELLLDDDELKITLLRVPPDGEPRKVGDAKVEGGSLLLWYTFPGRPYEVAAVHGPDGNLLGHYTNLVRPPEPEGDRWHITDRFLDLWQPAEGPPRVLDRDELRRARKEGWIGEEEAQEALETCRELLRRARAGDWPPPEVGSWPLEAVPSLRLRRDEPGLYHANLVAGRIIAFGIYFLGAASLTSAGFAAWSDALQPGGGARSWWLGALALEAAVLLPVALAGRLPATDRVRPREAMTEDTLFLGAAVAGAAVLLVNNSSLWRTLLFSVYGALSLFLGIFAACRAAYDRRLPGIALAGLAVCLAAFLLL